METIISPVDRALIEKELTEDKFIRGTNNADNMIFVITHHDSPNTMREIGRLREMTFRDAGGGTGKAIPWAGMIPTAHPKDVRNW